MSRNEIFYKDDILGYVTSSNSIPWLYDLDTCCSDDVTTVSSLVNEQYVCDSDCKMRAEDSMFSVTPTCPPDPPASEPVTLSKDPIQNGKVSRDVGFITSFMQSLSSSVMHDAHDVDEWKSLVEVSSAVSKLTKLYVRNVAVLGVTMMLSHAPFYGIRSFQSSLHGSYGRWVLVAYHVVLIGVVPFVRSIALSARIRPKTAVVLSVVAGLPFAVVAALPVSLETSVLLPVAAAAAGAATSWMSEMHDTYVTSLGVLCAALSDDHRDSGKAAARHFIKVFTQYLLVMQQLSLLVGNFATSSVYLMTHDLPPALSTSLGEYHCDEINMLIIVYVLMDSSSEKIFSDELSAVVPFRLLVLRSGTAYQTMSLPLRPCQPFGAI